MDTEQAGILVEKICNVEAPHNGQAACGGRESTAFFTNSRALAWICMDGKVSVGYLVYICVLQISDFKHFWQKLC